MSTQAIPKKVQILKFVAEQKFVTVGQVARKFNISKGSLRTWFYALNLAHIKFADISYGGVWKVGDNQSFRLIRRYYPQMPVLKLRRFTMPELEHCLRVNDIRILLENTSRFRVKDWQSEECIRATSVHLRDFPYNKIPDAVFKVDFGDDVLPQYLEYERSFKNLNRYKKIFGFYDSRPEISHGQVLYVCEQAKVKTKLARFPKMDSKYVFYTWLELNAKYAGKNRKG